MGRQRARPRSTTHGSTSSFPDLAEAYCFTLVHRLSPAEILRRLDGRPEAAQTGAAAVVDAAFDLFGHPDDHRQLIAMTTVGAWTVVIEPNGYLGVTEEKALPASAGTRWIAHFSNINGVDSFLRAEDTAKRLCFETLFPEARSGSHPDELLDIMHRIRFDFAENPPETEPSGPAAFALAEHLTGVRLTAQFLRETTFTCGSAPIP